MGRPTDWYVLDLPKDPTPGDPAQVQAFSGRLRQFADDVAAALRAIRGLAGDSAVQTWTGESGDAYRQHFDELPGELAKLERSYRMCSQALTTYWPQLQQAQRDVDRALEQGRQARSALQSAQSHLHTANDWVQRANEQAKQYQENPQGNVPPPSAEAVQAATRNAHNASTAQQQAQSAVTSAQSRLDAAKRLADDARRLRDSAAHTAKAAIDDASHAGIRNRRFWEKPLDWIGEHWDQIVAVCKVVVAVVGIIVMIVGGPLTWLVVAAALVVLADTIIKYMQGKASLWDVALAALDCIPGTKGPHDPQPPRRPGQGREIPEGRRRDEDGSDRHGQGSEGGRANPQGGRPNPQRGRADRQRRDRRPTGRLGRPSTT
ncbi:putative T7SS-secreted protein [Streptomyces sp. URMC 126]|uniref:putative T7SS-secreted protein n=1 Tax=Streptomyces sp. URMC 126 TaxID=3423401 RepID=UPI003F1A0B27